MKLEAKFRGTVNDPIVNTYTLIYRIVDDSILLGDVWEEVLKPVEMSYVALMPEEDWIRNISMKWRM